MESGEQEVGTRHQWPDRAFHWIMAACVLILCATAFAPIIGIRFDWLPIHWISGVILLAAILFHLVRIIFVHGFAAMLPGIDDLREMAGNFSDKAAALKAAKYDAFQKGYHWTAALVVLALSISGGLMLLKIDTVFWRRDPSIMSDGQWGIVYVIHGLSSLLILFLIIMHVYFSFLPEHRALLWSMLKGQGPLFTRGSGRP
jgi:formate dehydrogenase subunit gamma